MDLKDKATDLEIRVRIPIDVNPDAPHIPTVKDVEYMVKHGEKLKSNVVINGFGYRKWVEMLDKNVVAPENGIYILPIRCDNHLEYDHLELKRGENIWKKYIEVFETCYKFEDVDDYWMWYIPLAYHFVPYFSKESIYWKEYNEKNIKEDKWISSCRTRIFALDNGMYDYNLYCGFPINESFDRDSCLHPYFDSHRPHTVGYHLAVKYDEGYHAVHNRLLELYHGK